MKLLEDKRAARPMPTPVSKPDPQPERILSEKEPSPRSGLAPADLAHLKPINSPDFDIPPLIIPPLGEQTKTDEQTGKESDERSGKPSRRRNRRPGRSKPGADTSGTLGTPNEAKPPSGDQPAKAVTSGGLETNVQPTGEGPPTEGADKKTGRKRKRRRGRRNRGPKN